MAGTLRHMVFTSLEDATGTEICRSSELPGTLYLWIGGPDAGLTICVSTIEPLLAIRDAITEFELSEKVAEAAKRLIAQGAPATVPDAA